MKPNPFTMIVGGLVLLVVALLLFSFQVRQTEVALVTTFGKPTSTHLLPGWKFRWPWPIQQVQKFDRRIQNFEGRFKETYTSDRYTILVMVFAGWSINDPAVFRERFGGSLDAARNALDGLIELAKSAVVGDHPLSHLVSTDPQELKFDDIEKQMLTFVVDRAKSSYGIDVKFVGLKRVGLPESGTESVLNNMKEERKRAQASVIAQGELQARQIRNDAVAERNRQLSLAEARVIELQGEADAAAANSLAVFKAQPELGILLLQRQALIDSLKERSTLILGAETPPFNLLRATPPVPQK